jgi:hypothetical protein
MLEVLMLNSNTGEKVGVGTLTASLLQYGVSTYDYLNNTLYALSYTDDGEPALIECY